MLQRLLKALASPRTRDCIYSKLDLIRLEKVLMAILSSHLFISYSLSSRILYDPCRVFRTRRPDSVLVLKNELRNAQVVWDMGKGDLRRHGGW